MTLRRPLATRRNTPLRRPLRPPRSPPGPLTDTPSHAVVSPTPGHVAMTLHSPHMNTPPHTLATHRETVRESPSRTPHHRPLEAVAGHHEHVASTLRGRSERPLAGPTHTSPQASPDPSSPRRHTPSRGTARRPSPTPAEDSAPPPATHSRRGPGSPASTSSDDLSSTPMAGPDEPLAGTSPRPSQPITVTRNTPLASPSRTPRRDPPQHPHQHPSHALVSHTDR